MLAGMVEIKRDDKVLIKGTYNIADNIIAVLFYAGGYMNSYNMRARVCYMVLRYAFMRA